MAIRYKKLFKLLIDRDLKKKDLRDMTGISYATLQKLERGENVMTEVLDTICPYRKRSLRRAFCIAT